MRTQQQEKHEPMQHTISSSLSRHVLLITKLVICHTIRICNCRDYHETYSGFSESLCESAQRHRLNQRSVWIQLALLLQFCSYLSPYAHEQASTVVKHGWNKHGINDTRKASRKLLKERVQIQSNARGCVRTRVSA